MPRSWSKGVGPGVKLPSCSGYTSPWGKTLQSWNRVLYIWYLMYLHGSEYIHHCQKWKILTITLKSLVYLWIIVLLAQNIDHHCQRWKGSGYILSSLRVPLCNSKGPLHPLQFSSFMHKWQCLLPCSLPFLSLQWSNLQVYLPKLILHCSAFHHYTKLHYLML